MNKSDEIVLMDQVLDADGLVVADLHQRQAQHRPHQQHTVMTVSLFGAKQTPRTKPLCP